MKSGQIAVILDDGTILTSPQFHDYMGLNEYGKDITDDLDYVESVDEYKKLVKDFNKKHFEYSGDLFFYCTDLSDMTDPEGAWEAEYIYIKNLSEKPVILTDVYGQEIQLDADMVAAFKDGEFYACGSDNIEKRTFIEDLLDLKGSLSYDQSNNYCKIWNLCADYDNNHQNVYLTDRISEKDFVTEDLLEYIVKENATDLSRLRCFIGNTYDDDIYRLDGYGNLANVETGDFEDLIDELTEYLADDIRIPRAETACL